MSQNPFESGAMDLDISPHTGPTQVRYQVLAVGGSLGLLMYLQRQAFVRAIPKIQAEIGFSTEQVGLLTSVFLVAYGVSQVPCGLIGDRLGARHLLTFLVVGWSLMTGLSALVTFIPQDTATQFAILLALRFLFGSFQAGGFPVWARVVSDWMPVTDRGTAQGTIWMCSRLGGALSPLLFQKLYDYFGNWKIPLLIIAGIGIAWCAFFWPWFRNRPSEKSSVNSAEQKLIESGRTSVVDVGPVPWIAMLCSINIWALSLMYGCVGFAGNFVTNLLPVYLTSYRKLPDEVTTMITALPLFMGMISCALGGLASDWLTPRLGRKWGRRLVPSIGLAFAGLAVFAVPHVEAVWLLTFLFSASFFCNDLMMGSAWASCADVGERYAGTVSGIMNGIGQFAGAAGMYFAGVMLQRNHANALFMVFGCSYALAALCWMAVDVTRPLIPRTPEHS